MPALNPSIGQVVVVSGVSQSPDATLTLVLTAGAGVELMGNRVLTLTTGDGDRDVTLSGDLTVEADSIVNQDLTTDATVTFAVVLASLTGSTAPASIITSGTFADARIAESSVTQHEGAISITEAQINDLGTTAAMVADNLSVFAATTSAQLAGVISDETGTGALVFGTSPTIATPVLTLKQSVTPAPTAEGAIEWDTDNNQIAIGDGAGTKVFSDDAANAATYAAGSHAHATADVTSGTFADARIAESNVTQHKAAAHTDIGFLNLASPIELTISSGVVTATQSWHQLDTEADAASDDLDTINGGVEGHILVLNAINLNRTVVLKHGTGNILTGDAADISLPEFRNRVMLIFQGSAWFVLSSY